MKDASATMKFVATKTVDEFLPISIVFERQQSIFVLWLSVTARPDARCRGGLGFSNSLT
jgi:hypothetical protein